MGLIQKIFKKIIPRELSQKMEAESRQWIVFCPECGAEKSLWEMGGIRAGAKGSPRRYMKCWKCGKRSWHQIVKKPA